MRLRDRNIEIPPTTPDETPESGRDRVELQEQGAALLAAADEAINRALSNDSTEFLRQNRQSGGQ